MSFRTLETLKIQTQESGQFLPLIQLDTPPYVQLSSQALSEPMRHRCNGMILPISTHGLGLDCWKVGQVWAGSTVWMS